MNRSRRRKRRRKSSLTKLAPQLWSNSKRERLWRRQRSFAPVADSKSSIVTTWWPSTRPGTASVSGATNAGGHSTRPCPVSLANHASIAVKITTGTRFDCWLFAGLRINWCRLPFNTWDIHLINLNFWGSIVRLFAGRKQCAKCCETLQPDELVMRGREHLFHTRCFSCHICQTHLIKGSTFGMVGALIFCQQHYQQGTVQSGFGHPGGRDNNNMPIQHPSFPVHNASVEAYMTHHQEPFGSPHHPYDPHGHQHYGQLIHQSNPSMDSMLESSAAKLYHQNSPVSGSSASSLKNQRVRTKRRMQPSIKSDMQASLMNEGEDDSYMSVDGAGMLDTSSSSPCSSMLNGCVTTMGSMGGANGVHQQQQQVTSQQQQKTKRLRTSFKHHQLRMLKSYFATNHNPDAKDLKQLSQKTTLSKRVLQVMEQNKTKIIVIFPLPFFKVVIFFLFTREKRRRRGNSFFCLGDSRFLHLLKDDRDDSRRCRW